MRFQSRFKIKIKCMMFKVIEIRIKNQNAGLKSMRMVKTEIKVKFTIQDFGIRCSVIIRVTINLTETR